MGKLGLRGIPTADITLPDTSSSACQLTALTLHEQAGGTEDFHATHHATSHQLIVLILHGH